MTKRQFSVIVLIILGILSSIALILFVAIPYYMKLQKYAQEKSDYTKNTTPLTQEVVNDICKKFSIPAENARCQPGAIVYAPEFYEVIKEYFNNLPEEEATFEKVQEKIGVYLIDRGELFKLKDGSEYFRATYDLKGDHVNRIAINFSKDGYILSIMITGGES